MGFSGAVYEKDDRYLGVHAVAGFHVLLIYFILNSLVTFFPPGH